MRKDQSEGIAIIYQKDQNGNRWRKTLAQEKQYLGKNNRILWYIWCYSEEERC